MFVLTGMAAGPVIGVLVQRHPLRRSWLVLGVVGANAAGWGLVLLWPGQAPLPVLVLLVLALGLGGPGSMIGFEFARTFNPPNRLGTATGIVNVGGFVASLLTILLIGLILDARTGGTARLRPRPTSRSRCPCNIWSARSAWSASCAPAGWPGGGWPRTGVVVRPIREVLAERRGLALSGR